MKINIFILTFSCLLSGETLLRANTASEALTIYAIDLKHKFPDVPTLSTEELAVLDPTPLLLDVREEKEYAVSHLPKAIRVGKNPAEQLKELEIAKDAPIVVYCSVGYRSSLLAQTLLESGFSDVRNLEGSLFAWANEDRPLVNKHGVTNGAHPYNILWGRFLDKSKWHWKPAKNPGE